MDKYYTPDITEFHVGFEFESNYVLFQSNHKGLEWNKCKMTGDEFAWFHETYINDAYKTEFRVKYLDKEDIESLGWKYVVDNSQGDGNTRWFDVFEMKGRYYTFGFHGHVEELGDNLCDKAIIYARNQSEILFSGKIKNKSELRKIMQMIGISENPKE